MEVTPNFLVLYLLIVFFSVGSGFKIKFFKQDNYTGLFLESNSTAKCNNFAGNSVHQIKSVTTDTCVVVYSHMNCRSPSSGAFELGNYSTTNGEYWGLGSFHHCNEEERSSQLDVDITTYYDDKEPTNIPDVLESHKSVCSCINVPDHVQQMEKWSINNHHNALVAYYQPNCSVDTYSPTIINAGHRPETRDMHIHFKTDPITKIQRKIQSFGPARTESYYNASCIEMTSSQARMSEQKSIESNVNHTDVLGLTEKIRQLETKTEEFEQKLSLLEHNKKQSDEKVANLQSQVNDLQYKLSQFEQKSGNCEKNIDDKLEKLKEALEEKINRIGVQLDW